MARAPRNDAVEMNFDGLTDSITNLVGNLILIVVLMYGVTSEVTIGEPPQAVAAPAAQRLPPPARTGTKHVSELLLQIEVLQAGISEVDREMKELEQRVPDLQSRAEAILRKATT